MSAGELEQAINETINEGSQLFNFGRCQECSALYFDCAQRCIASPSLTADCRTVLQQAMQRAANQFKETGRSEQSAWVLRSALDYTQSVLSPMVRATMPQTSNPFIAGGMPIATGASPSYIQPAAVGGMSYGGVCPSYVQPAAGMSYGCATSSYMQPTQGYADSGTNMVTLGRPPLGPQSCYSTSYCQVQKPTKYNQQYAPVYSADNYRPNTYGSSSNSYGGGGFSTALLAGGGGLAAGAIMGGADSGGELLAEGLGGLGGAAIGGSYGGVGGAVVGGLLGTLVGDSLF